MTNKERWERFFEGVGEKTFLQSWNWGEFQKKMNNKIWRLGLFEDSEDPVSVVLAVRIKARRGRFLLVPHGPSLQDSISNQNYRGQILNLWLEKLKEIAKKENCSFIRIAPLWERNEENNKIFKDLGFKKSPMHASAYEATWKLDLMPSEHELLMKMRKTTRYLIRQAEKNSEIEIIKSERSEDADLFDKLARAAAEYQKFVPFSYQFVKNEFEAFCQDRQALWLFAKYRGEIISAALIIFWLGVGFYHQAALNPKYRKIPASYLLEWEAIKEAKKRGCLRYDFWGYVDPQKYPQHPWAGPTLFKMGFGGRAYEYVKTQDWPISFLRYWPIYVFEKLRKVRRNL